MDFKYNLLTIAILASALTACGESSKSSSAKDKTPGIPGAPKEEPQNVAPVLTDAQKETLGKAFIAGLSEKVTSFSTQTAGIAKGYLNATNNVDQEASPGDYQLKQGLMVISNILPALQDNVYRARQLIHSTGEGSASYGENIELGIRGMVGNVVVTLATDGSEIFTFDTDYTPPMQQTPLTSDLQLIVTRNSLTYTPNVAGDPADTEDQFTVNGTINNNDMNLTIERAALSAIYDKTPTQGDPNDSGSMKKVSFTISKLTVTSAKLTAEAEVEALFEQPLQEKDGVYFYSGLGSPTTSSTTLGTLGTMKATGPATSFGPVLISNPFYSITELIAPFTPEHDGAELSLNIHNVSLKNVKISVDEGSDYLALKDVSFTGNDSLYALEYGTYGDNAAYGGQTSFNSYGGGYYATLATYEYDEAHTQLTVKDPLGSAIYTFKSGEDSNPAGVTCALAAKASIVEPYLGFSGDHCMSNNFTPAESLDAFIDRVADTVSTPRPNRPTVPVRFEASEDNSNKGTIHTVYRVKPYFDSIDGPVDFMVSAQGSLSAGGVITPFSMQLHHPSTLDYQLTAQIGEQDTSMVATWGTLNPNFKIKTKIDYSGHTFDASLNFDMAKTRDLRSSADAVVANGYTTVTAGTIVIDGLTVANVLFHSDINGPEEGFIDGNNPFVLPKGFPVRQSSAAAISISFLDGMTPTGSLFTDVAEFSTTQKVIDCPEDPVMAMPETTPPSVECTENVVHSLNGVVDLKSLTEAFLGELAPYTPAKIALTPYL